MSDALMARTILLTRPADQADALIRLIEKSGGKVIHLPMQRIEARRAGPRGPLIEGEPDDDWWIFTSANAVTHFIHGEHPARSPRIAAVGAATAAALEQAGLAVDLVPDGAYTSEGLLEMPALQDVKDNRILIVTGRGGRGLLAEELAARGAAIRLAEVYQRLPTTVSAEQVAKAVDAADVVAITNSEALERLLTLCPESAREQLLGLPLVVPTARVVERARALGFKGAIAAPEMMNDAAIAKAIADCLPAHGSKASMTDEQSTAEPTEPAVADKPRRSGGAVLALLWILVLVIAGAAAWAGWFGWQYMQETNQQQAQINQQIDGLRQELAAAREPSERMAEQLSDAIHANQQISVQVSALEQQQQQASELIGSLGQSMQGGRVEMELAGIEQLLLLANDRVQLAGDIHGAVLALEAVDRRLSAMADPRLFAVRQAVNEERGELLGIAKPDIASAALAIGSLIRRAGTLPLLERTPTSFERPEQAAPATVADPAWYQRAWASVRVALTSMYSVRKEETEIRRLMPPEAQALTVELLRLKLEGARVALLRRDAVLFVDQLDAADAWLGEQFLVGDEAVVAARQEIVRLRGLRLAQTLPDISGSLVRLRAYLESARS